MNKDEIKKALEYCQDSGHCRKCPYYPKSRCNDMLCKDAHELITEQEKEIERLKAENEKRLTCDFVKTAQKQAKIDVLNKAKKKRAYSFILGQRFLVERDIDEMIEELQK